MEKKKKPRKKDVPVTGILIVLIAVLIVCLLAVLWLTRQQKSAQEGGQQQKNEIALENGESGFGKKDGETDFDTGQSETEEEAESDTNQTQTGDPESESKDGQKDAEKPETETVQDVVIETEAEAETETETEAETEERLTVAIDPGHQGNWVDMSALEPNAPGSSEMKAKSTTGTQGAYSGKAEYELNLEISLLLRDELEARGYEVILTREDNDTAISNAQRATKAYEEGGDIYVRIHANGSDDSSVSGALAMVPSASNPYVGNLASDSYTLAECILDGYCRKASFASLGIQYYDNMTGINWSKIPVMILEMGFMTNQSDDLRMADAAVQPLMAEGIADGIDAYFVQKGMKKKKVSAKDTAQMNALIETLGEEFVYPAMEKGEAWAVSFVDLNSKAEGSLNGDVQMASASVIKVFLMAAIYDRVCYPSSEERYLPFEESYDGELKSLITDMITVSDNTAANTLLTRLGGGYAAAGMAVVNQFCEEQGYTATVMGRKFLEENPSGDNLTSADDCRRLLQSIYEGTCVNAEASAKMYAYLRNQTRTGKIPAGVSNTTAVTANKTGELAGEYGQYVENDIAVIEDGDSAYVLCILSGNLKDNEDAVSRIARMSGTAYRLLTGK